jgi:hypothetical protein
MREIRGEVESVRELVPRVSLLFTHSRTPALRNDSQPIVLMSDWRRDWICCKGS